MMGYFAMDWSFRVSLKFWKITNERLLKIGITGVGKKMWAGKGMTHSKGFPENTSKVFRALNTPVKRSLEKITVVS